MDFGASIMPATSVPSARFRSNSWKPRFGRYDPKNRTLSPFEYGKPDSASLAGIGVLMRPTVKRPGEEVSALPPGQPAMR